MNKRLLIAIVLSFTVLIGFSYLFPTPKPQQNIAKQESNTTKNNITPPVTQDNATDNKAVSTPNMASSTNQKSPNTDITDTIATIKTKRYTLTIDKLGRINSAVLSDNKYKTDDGKKLDLIDRTKTMPLEVRFADSTLNELAFKTPYTTSTKSLDATNKTSTITLDKWYRVFIAIWHYNHSIRVFEIEE